MSTGEKRKKKLGLKGLFDGSILVNDYVTQQLPFALFVACLAILYIANRYSAERIVKNINELGKEVKELRSESIATASELMYKSKQSVIASECERRGMGIVEAVEPPIILKVDSDGDLDE